MGIGFMVDWRCAFPVQSPSPAGPSTRPQQQQQCLSSLMRGRNTSFETARVSILRSIQEESEVLHTHILRSYTNSLGISENSTSNCVKMEEVNVYGKHGGSSKLSGIIKNKMIEDTISSYNVLRFSLLMENLDEIEDMLVDSKLAILERDILIQMERLGALNFFHDCLSRTYMTPVSLDLAFPITEPREYSVNVNHQTGNIVVPSRRKKERELRRTRASEKAASTSSLLSSSEIVKKDRSGTVSFAADLTWTHTKTISKRHSIARNEVKMSMGVKDVAKLEKIHLELEERTGRTASILRWAQAAGTDEKALRQRLHFGWHCKDRLLRSTRSLVIYLARSYRGMGIAFDDLIQAGTIGVLRGAKRFDPSRGYKFSTYVQYWIRKSMSAVITQHSRGIHIPVTMEKAIKQVQKARRTLSSTDRRCPKDVEVAECTGLSLDKVRLAGKCARSVRFINQKIGNDLNIKAAEVTPDITIRNPEETVMRQHLRKDINKLLENLHPRERRVLLLRYGFVDGRRMSLEEIGQVLQVSKEWIRRIEMAALTKLRKDEIQGELKHYLHLHFS